MSRVRYNRRMVLAANLAAVVGGAPLAGAQQRADVPAPSRASPAVIDTSAQPLWPGGAPFAQGRLPADQPTVAAYLPAAGTGNGTAVVVFPGGGYTHLAMGHEGHDVARWLNSLGIAAFVVQYRLGPAYHHPVMLNDAQRAVRTVRARAAEWGVNPARVGVIGFSAGGHLASTAGTHFDAGKPGATDPIESASSRPDFMLLIYPVITMDGPFVHQGSRAALLGATPAPALVRLLSNDLQVSRETPPTFLMHTGNDSVVPVENSLRFYEALRRAGVPAELHVYERGRHGVGLAPDDPVLSSWPQRAAAWLSVHGWLGSAASAVPGRE